MTTLTIHELDPAVEQRLRYLKHINKVLQVTQRVFCPCINCSKDVRIIMLKTAPPQYEKLLNAALSALGFPHERRPIIIGIDGQGGAGKTHVASWLAWQLGAKALHLDLYFAYDTEGRRAGWRIHDLAYAIERRVDAQKRPIIVEGVFLLEALNAIKRNADFLVYARRRETRSYKKLPSVVRYLRSRNPPVRKSDHSLLGW